jgi:hypothetical protein
MSKQVAVKQGNLEQTALALKSEAEERGAALRELGVETADLVIPSIQVMQGTSALVGDGKAVLADIVNMQTEEVLAKFGTGIKILPLKLFKTLRTYNVQDSGFKFMGEEPLTAANDKLQGEGLVDGVPVKRYHTFNFFVLLKTDLDKGEGFPCLLRFRSTGMNAGRALATYLYKQVFFRKKPYANFVELSVKKEKKDTATYGVPVITAVNPLAATPGELAAAESWLAMLAAGNYKLADAEEPSEEVGTAAKPVVMGAEIFGVTDGEY